MNTGWKDFDLAIRAALFKRGRTHPQCVLAAEQGQLLFNQDQLLDKRREFIYLGGSLIAERSHPTKTAAPVTVTYQHTDALGSPIAVSRADKTIQERSEYEPYGQLLNRPLTSGPGFTGHMQDPATGLTYMQQRYYDPALGRFLSVDPVTAYSNPMVAFNRYWYANDNPYKFTDPDGRESGCIYAGGCGGPASATQNAVAGLALDFVPGVGDAKGFVDAYNDPSAVSIAAALIGLAGPVGDGAAKLIKGADKAISMETAIDAGVEHAGAGADVVMTKGGNVQFTSTTTDAAGNTVTRNAKFDMNPASGHVQKQGPHLNLETQVNGRKVGAGPHTPIKPETIRRGDYD